MGSLKDALDNIKKDLEDLKDTIKSANYSTEPYPEIIYPWDLLSED